ncbi:TonB-dependent receptor [Dyadobacter flavalbus]|uniref:TonB-dependent receptor n=1 Tax=Dyadobacter flavalbus TaxID=2579942 RepID=A0A5M8QQM6_9BACT|nr:TonB-dependent receptor [Dyadobacter flavalbus]KAA6438557.1 TonB-dependent receptor [Dyadobacter flavalbus]
MKSLLLSFLLLIIRIAAYAHLGSLEGRVTDAASGLPLRGVSVQLAGTGKATLTNELGQYRFSELVASAYKLEFSYIGYAPHIQEVTVTDELTTKVQTKMTVAPVMLSTVTVSGLKAHDQQLISSLDIRLRPVTNSQEILRIVPGLFIGQHAGGGKAEQIFLRGFDIDHGTDIRLSLDGMPVNMVSHAHGQGYADLHFVIPELVETVNFKKGPYTTDIGNFTTAGWANLKTKTTLDNSFIKLEGGQFGTFRAVGGLDLLRRKDKNQSAYLASEYSYSDSYFDNPQNFKRFNLQGKYHGHLSANTNLTVTGSTFWSKWNHSGQIPNRAVASGLTGFFGSVDPTEGGQTSRTNFNAETVTVTSSGYTLKNQLFYSNYHFELYSNFTFFLKDSINGDQIRQKEMRDLFGYQGSIARTNYVGNVALISTAGLQYRQDLTRGTELSHTKNRTETLERQQYGKINELNASAYLDEVIQFSDRFSANAGIRFDYFRNQYEDLLLTPAAKRRSTSAIISPKLNLYYTANPGLQLYLNSGKSFHSNDTRVVVADNGRKTLPPAYGFDAGTIFKPFPKLLVNAAAWYLWLAQEFVYVGDEGVVEPSGKTRRYGLDLSIRYELTRHLYADLDLNAAKPRTIGVEAGQDYLPLAPTLTSVGGLSLRNAGAWSGSLRYRYMGTRPANEDNSIVAKGYFVNDLQLNYTRPSYALGLSVQNLFNTRWKETQFATESRLRGETASVEEIHFTPGTPLAAKLSFTYFLK